MDPVLNICTDQSPDWENADLSSRGRELAAIEHRLLSGDSSQHPRMLFAQARDLLEDRTAPFLVKIALESVSPYVRGKAANEIRGMVTNEQEVAHRQLRRHALTDQHPTQRSRAEALLFDLFPTDGKFYYLQMRSADEASRLDAAKRFTTDLFSLSGKIRFKGMPAKAAAPHFSLSKGRLASAISLAVSIFIASDHQDKEADMLLIAEGLTPILEKQSVKPLLQIIHAALPGDLKKEAARNLQTLVFHHGEDLIPQAEALRYRTALAALQDEPRTSSYVNVLISRSKDGEESGTVIFGNGRIFSFSQKQVFDFIEGHLPQVLWPVTAGLVSREELSREIFSDSYAGNKFYRYAAFASWNLEMEKRLMDAAFIRVFHTAKRENAPVSLDELSISAEHIAEGMVKLRTSHMLFRDLYAIVLSKAMDAVSHAALSADEQQARIQILKEELKKVTSS